MQLPRAPISHHKMSSLFIASVYRYRSLVPQHCTLGKGLKVHCLLIFIGYLALLTEVQEQQKPGITAAPCPRCAFELNFWVLIPELIT